jgi:hypothetical protein
VADLAVIVPSRGRPQQLAEMAQVTFETAEGSIRVVACVDDEDPLLTEYQEVVGRSSCLDMAVGPRRSLSGWTNHIAKAMLDWYEPPRYFASLGDDHHPRTKGWDRRLIAAIESLGGAPGIAYGNDLLQGARLPTAWIVSAELVRAVGWMMLPTCEHMYVDNAVLALGQALGRILYCPDVVIEHLHPAAGKAALDDSYRETNSVERYAADRLAFEAWRDGGGLARDIAKVAIGPLPELSGVRTDGVAWPGAVTQIETAYRPDPEGVNTDG